MAMKDAFDILQEILGDDILSQVTNYSLRRGNWEFDIYIYRLMNGPRLGTYIAVPRIALSSAATEYQGVGKTESEALRDCLKRTHGLAYKTLFPDETSQDS